MAQPIGCDICSAELAVQLVTNLGNGDTMGVGASCLHQWAIALADATKPQPSADVAPPHSDGPGSDVGERAAARPPRPRQRAPRPTVVPDGTDHPVTAETAPDATAN